MEFSQDMLIDLSLNVAGYLIAGLLGMTIYSIFRRQESKQVLTTNASDMPVEEKTFVPVPIKSNQVTPSPATSASKNFIQFGKQQDVTAEATPEKRRDRSEILRIALQMISAGATTEKIKQVLPISEAELSLLQLSKKV